jgi:hypothetical protein
MFAGAMVHSEGAMAKGREESVMSRSLGAWVLGVCLLHSATLPAAGCTDAGAHPAAKGNGTAQTVYLDPDTGELLSAPPPGAELPGMLQAPPPLPPLVEKVMPDGTVVADIGRRFIHPLRAEIVDGQLVTCHGSEPGTAGTAADDTAHERE